MCTLSVMTAKASHRKAVEFNCGRDNPEYRSEAALELEDLLYFLRALVDHLEVDLESQPNKTLYKYRKRVTQGGTPDSINGLGKQSSKVK